MYRYSNGQISLSDFQQPMGMCLREDNRWVKKAQSIPWDKLEAKYADLFPSETGNVAKSLQLALGACLIQREYGYSDVETVLQIKAQKGRGSEQGSGLPGRVRTGRGRTQIQFGKTEVWNGSGDSEAGRNGCACGCPVHFVAESV